MILQYISYNAGDFGCASAPPWGDPHNAIRRYTGSIKRKIDVRNVLWTFL